MWKILKYLENYKKECVLAPLFKLLEATFELFVPLVVASMIDKGMAMGDKGYIYKCVVILVVLAMVGLVSAITAQFFAAKAAVGFSKELRKDLFAHLLTLSFKEYDELGESTMITRMTSDVMQCQAGVNLFLRLTLRSPFIVFGAMIMAFTIDARAALIFVVVIVVLFIVVAIIMRLNIPLLEKAQGLLDRVLLLTRENLTGVRVIRAFTREKLEEADFNNKTDELYAGQMVAARLSSLMNPATYVVINLAIVCLIYVGAVRVDAGSLSRGSVVALYNYMSQILVELIKLANMIVTTNKAIASGNRIGDVFDITNSQNNKISTVIEKDSHLDDDVAVEFDNVSFKYSEGGDAALNSITFKAKKGEYIGIIGGTGSGKSTLISLIPRFYDVTTGRVKVFNQNVNDYEQAELRKKIAVCFQKAALFTGSIADNLRYGNQDATHEDMIKSMELAVAMDVIEAKGGLDAYVGEAGKELSGGQRQRITIARTLIGNPDILIFDDSTSALDFATQAKFIENLKSIKEKPTIFVASQRTNVMLGADKIIVLEDGEIVDIGKHEELLLRCKTYQEIHNTQNKSDV